MGVEASASRAGAYPARGPSHQPGEQLGTSGTNLAVPAGGTAESLPAPRDGLVLVSIPDGMTARVRVGAGAVAGATDQPFYGPEVWHWPIRRGERVSLYGDGSTGTASVGLAR